VHSNFNSIFLCLVAAMVSRGNKSSNWFFQLSGLGAPAWSTKRHAPQASNREPLSSWNQNHSPFAREGLRDIELGAQFTYFVIQHVYGNELQVKQGTKGTFGRRCRVFILPTLRRLRVRIEEKPRAHNNTRVASFKLASYMHFASCGSQTRPI
jgi:hypothetical protein